MLQRHVAKTCVVHIEATCSRDAKWVKVAGTKPQHVLAHENVARTYSRDMLQWHVPWWELILCNSNLGDILSLWRFPWSSTSWMLCSMWCGQNIPQIAVVQYQFTQGEESLQHMPGTCARNIFMCADVVILSPLQVPFVCLPLRWFLNVLAVALTANITFQCCWTCRLSIINDELHVRNASPAQVEVCGFDSLLMASNFSCSESTYLLQFSVK